MYIFFYTEDLHMKYTSSVENKCNTLYLEDNSIIFLSTLLFGVIGEK